MKKIVISISDFQYEKFRLEAIELEKDVGSVIQERIMERPFSKEILDSLDKWMFESINAIANEKWDNYSHKEM